MRATELSPVISLLIAARNEESTILNCLLTISQLDYPANAVEVLIGDDPGDRLIGIGVILFAVGMIAVLAVFLPFWVGVNETGLLLGLAALLTVVGLGCALAGLYQQAKPRTDRR